jgi:sterol desaturase/sphingolipid hydroxylase (fatty acid hydroxylase superfamily)
VGFFLATVPVIVMMGNRAVAPALITVYVMLGTLPPRQRPLNLRPARKVVVSPAYHRVHHAIDGRDGANLGIVLTLRDVVTGRAIFPVAGTQPADTGLAGRPLAVEQVSSGTSTLRLLLGQLAEPFGPEARAG